MNTDSAQITRGVDLRQLTANAEVRLAGAEIGGRLVCDDASFKASEAIALNAQGVRVSDGIYFRRVTSGGGTISFADSYIRTIVDDLHSWPPQGQLIFEGLTYDSMLNSDFPVVTDRLDWLAKGSNWNGEFFPQPYTQLAKVYLLMGHDSEARAVLFERERLLMRQRFNTHWTLHNGDPNTGVPMTNTNYHTMFWSFLLRFAVGYGYKPFRSLIVLLFLIFTTATFSDRAWKSGDFAPNAGPVLVSSDWQRLSLSEATPAKVWVGDRTPVGWQTSKPEAVWKEVAPGRDWETFHPLAYGADVAIPIVDFGQTDAWAPSTTRGIWGELLWWWRWVATILGWIVTALGAAAITGIIRRD